MSHITVRKKKKGVLFEKQFITYTHMIYFLSSTRFEPSTSKRKTQLHPHMHSAQRPFMLVGINWLIKHSKSLYSCDYYLLLSFYVVWLAKRAHDFKVLNYRSKSHVKNTTIKYNKVWCVMDLMLIRHQAIYLTSNLLIGSIRSCVYNEANYDTYSVLATFMNMGACNLELSMCFLS